MANLKLETLLTVQTKQVLKTPIWIDTEIKLDHMGAYNFAGDVNQISKLVEQWTKNEDIKSADDQIKAYEFAPKDS